MTAIEDLLKLGEFPAVQAYLKVRGNELDEDPAFEQGRSYVRDRADLALEELADKLVKSIEWGRIEQRRKQQAEEEVQQQTERREEEKLRAVIAEGALRRLLAGLEGGFDWDYGPLPGQPSVEERAERRFADLLKAERGEQ